MKHVAFTFLLVIACTVQAEVLINDTSNNGSFETPDLNGSGWIAGNAPPWLALSGSMFVQHDASVPDGDQFGGAGWDCGGMVE